MRILCAEDSPDLVKVWKIFFKQTHHQVVFFETGKDAIDSLKDACLPDIVITDYGLPDTNGLSLIKEIRGISPGIPALIVTGNDDIEFLKLVDTLDGVETLMKPVRFKDLLEKIEQMGGVAAA